MIPLLAKRYATALVEIAQEQNALDKYAGDLDSLSKLVEASRDFREILTQSCFHQRRQEKDCRACVEKNGRGPDGD